MKTDDLLSGLPGETLVRKGLADLKSGRYTIAACLAAIARNRLIAAGVIAEEEAPTFLRTGTSTLSAASSRGWRRLFAIQFPAARTGQL